MSNKIVVLEGNKEKEYDVLFTVDDAKANEKYIVYTDNSKDKDGNAVIYLGKYKNKIIIPLDSNSEKEKLERVVNLIQEEVCNNEG